jgi:hypothetical protein
MLAEIATRSLAVYEAQIVRKLYQPVEVCQQNVLGEMTKQNTNDIRIGICRPQ